jgi:hypothetical protein
MLFQDCVEGTKQKDVSTRLSEIPNGEDHVVVS